ncbi:MAG TPA: penicillin-binding protein 1C [Candidatus Hydrogenedentes bacterium]|nr:penicillin-binding protein 1C [Candidatus Hydrogenedentota bacterium]
MNWPGKTRMKRLIKAAAAPRRMIPVCAAIALAAAVMLAWPMDTQPFLKLAASSELLDREGRPLYVFLNEEEQWCFPRPMAEMSPHLIKATLATEDQRFRLHPGVDPLAIVRAAVSNIRGAGVVSGASTLTMQVAKRGLAPTHSVSGKLRQAVAALRLERRISKDEILETYLNSAPYGLNLVGCEAASLRYFGKPARELNLPEAALLAGLPKAPGPYMPLEHPAQARQRRNHVLKRMHDEGYIDADEFARACKAPLGAAWHELPALSPHLAMSLRPLADKQGRVRTTLDFDVQARIEQIVRERLRYYPGEITNAAVIVIDTQAGEVRARVASGDFYDTPGGGQVDACRALRSPGSTLKPFIYALAMDSDCLYASETLNDGTLDYGRYAPENFDDRYRGLVTADKALQLSLNVPAVTILERLDVDRFHAFLPRAGITTVVKPPEHYGLGLTLGNCEVRLDEMAAAYCMLANLGVYRPLRIHELQQPGPETRQLTRGACLKIFEMLEQTPPDEFERELVPVCATKTRVAWKTGTSTDYRDAWTFMFNRHYVVGVWMGNNDASSSKWLVGATVALPLAAKIFRALDVPNTPAWPEAGDDLREIRVCAVSGLPATPWCSNTRRETLPRSQYLHRVCDMHHPAGPGSADIVERWPGDTRGWDLAAVRDPRIVDLTSPKTHPERHDTLAIQHPSEGAVYVLTGEPMGDRIRLRASIERVGTLHWYLDDRYLGGSGPEAPVYLSLSPGNHKLTCLAPDGVLDTVRFEVVSPEDARRMEPKRPLTAG